MKRTPPRLSDLVPELRAKVRELAALHDSAFPERALCLIWGLRSVAEQRAAYAAGRSKLDGVKRHSLHAYGLAADLWVYTGDHAEDHGLFQGRPPRKAGLRLQLRRGALRAFYWPMARIAREVGLEPGAFWRMGDGPHVQLSRKDRFCVLQAALDCAGYHPGPVDGAVGKRTRAAMEAAGKDAGIPWRVSWRMRRLFPMRPELWAWIRNKGEGAS